MWEVILDAVLDSLKVLGLSLILYILLSFFEDKITAVLQKHRKISPVLGASVGLIPQCGFSVVAADLYIKEHITMGTLFAVFFACSDEALPILLSRTESLPYVFPLLGLKFLFGFILGYGIDAVRQSRLSRTEADGIRLGCCGHEADFFSETPLRKHLLHPLLHSLKIFLYVLAVNLVFGLVIYSIGEDNILRFLTQSRYLTPLVAGLVGLIPNCASSVLLSELFIMGGIPFGALFTGLCVNAGLGLVYLLKNRKSRKEALLLVALLLVSALVLGYAVIGIMQLWT